MEDITPEAPVVDAYERFALMQLCSTAYLASGRLDEAACVGLLNAGLVSRDRGGFWSATDKGRELFACIEEQRRENGLNLRRAD